MKIVDVVSFINPFGDMLSTVFVILLVGLSMVTIFCLLKSANEENWEKNWNGEHLEGSASLDSEHGSVYELAEAVSTKSEQVADIMPSMLLVLGLLGTFIGLGIALNSASDVLAHANTSGMDNAMANLMSLMEGLGAKFKTSTWGLLCFITLNILFNVIGFKEKRLAWVIAKVKQETKIKNAQKVKLEQDRYNELLQSVVDFNKQMQANNQIQQELLNKNLKIQFEGLKANLGAVQAIEQQLKQGFEQYIQQLQHTSQNQIVELQNIISTNESLVELSKNNSQDLIQSLNHQNQEVVKTLNEGFQQHIEQLRNDSQQHISELQNIVTSNQAIQNASEITTNELKNVVQSLTDGFNDNSAQLKKGSEQSLSELKKIADYNKQTQQAMKDFVDKTVSSMASIGDSADKMGESAQAVGKSATDLNGVVQTLKSELGDVMSMIKKDLGETISDMSDNFKENITEMSASIQQNMTEMSESMSNATKGIESAVGNLSTNVGQTMNEVTQTIGKSMELQVKSSNSFAEISQLLSEEIVKMINLVDQLRDEIVGSLKSVAENGCHMRNIGKKLEGFSEFIENLSNTNPKLIEHLEKITTHNEEIANSLSQLLEKNEGEHWQNLMEMNKSIKNELNTLVALLGQSVHTKHYEKILENIHASLDDLSKQLTTHPQQEQKELDHAEKAE